MKISIFKGVGTAIITPFNEGKIDFIAFENLIEKQINAGISALIVLGTTGEASTISDNERIDLINFTVAKCKGKCKVIVGTGSNNTLKAIEYYNMAENLGADGALIVTPYYNKCTQNGIIDHYKAIANTGKLPIIVYNVPSRTGVNILPETMDKLCEIDNVYGIKEASGNISQILEIFRLVKDRVAIYSGEDSLNHIFAMLGGDGSISVLSNIVPKICVDIQKACFDGNVGLVNQLQQDVLVLINKLFLEVNPIPIKAGLSYIGLCKNELRLPLTKMQDENFEKLKIEINKVFAKYDCL